MADFSLAHRFAQGSRNITIIIMILALSVLIGWEFDIDLLKRPLHLKAMNPVSAVCFLFFSVSFWVMGFSTPTRTKSIFAYTLIFFILVAGLAKILAIFTGLDLHIDTLLFSDKIYNDTLDGAISLMPFNTALNFTILSVALLFTFRSGKINKTIANFLILILLFLALFSIIIYVYRVSEFLETLSYFTMAIHTAFGFVLVAMAVWFFNSEEGFSAVISNPGSGGTIARILLPAALIAPVIIGLLRLIFFEWRHKLSVELGVSVLIISIIIIFFSLVLFASHVIVKKDALRLEAEGKLIEFTKNLEEKVKNRTAEILKRENRFRALIENSADAILLTDEKLRLLYQSPAVERMTGISIQERSNNPGYRYTHPADLPIIQKLVNESLQQPGTPFPFQIRFMHKDGNPIWIEGFITNLLQDENVKALVFNYKNINERKDIEEKLVARELRFRALIENINDGIVMNDENSVLLYQSPSVERILGYSFEERLKKPVRNFVHPDNQKDFELLYQSLAKNPGKSLPFQYRFLHKNGHYLWLEGQVTNLNHLQGVNAYIANYRDITERKESEEKIASNEQRFRILIENNADAISLTDKNLKVTYQSPQGEKITGYTQEERAALDAKDLLHPDDIAILAEEYPKLFAHPEKPISFHYRLKHKHGHYIWLEGSLKNLLDDPTINAIVVNFRDVSERKFQEEKLATSEMRFRTLIENNFDCILLTTENSELLYQSPSVERITGFAPPEKKSMSEFFRVHPDDVENAKILSIRLRQNPGTPIRFQLRFPRKNGEYMWAEGVSTNFLQDARVNAIVTNFRDVTDQKVSEAEILKLNAELEVRVQKRTTELQEANKELESFSYSVSHDLRAPLRIINGFSQILIDDYAEKLDSHGQLLINKIMRNAHRMGQLIDDLLNFSKLGRAEMRLSVTNMSALVQEVLTDLETSGISIPSQLHVGELKPCYCDSPLIKQVWINLISNAIKYSSKREGPTIEIGMTTDSTPTYFVKDNGAGFDMTYIHKLFAVFQRLHKAPEFEGTGVGLAIVKRILSRHGGDVWAEAKENEGATFFFQIPE
jgi:PAS domain S-box-containing protein